MKSMAAWFLIGFLSLGFNAWAIADDAVAAAEKAVAELENVWLKSQRTNNPELIAPHWTDTIVSTSSDGRVLDKAGLLASAKASKYTSVDYTDIKITVYGDAAVATGTFKGAGTDAEGKPFHPAERWTDTWVKMPDGSWKCAATHSSLIGN